MPQEGIINMNNLNGPKDAPQEELSQGKAAEGQEQATEEKAEVAAEDTGGAKGEGALVD